MSKFLSKEELEQAYFNSFSHFETKPHWLGVKKSESPDFLITMRRKIVGVEITALYTTPATAALEDTKDGVVAASQRAARELNFPPVNVTLFFNLRTPLRREDRERLGRKVAAVVKGHIPQPGQHFELDMVEGQPSEVDLILIYPPLRSEGDWRWTEAGRVRSDISQFVQSAIDKKNKKIVRYLEKCDECWLLIAVNSFRPSGKLRLSSKTGPSFQSHFRRTYFLDWGRGNLSRLSTHVTPE